MTALINRQQMDTAETATTSTSSDSGRYSCQEDGTPCSPTHRHSQSNPHSQSVSPRAYSTPNTPKRGFISTYLEEQKKRHTREFADTSTIDNGVLVEAPVQFRTPDVSRPVSIADSNHSNYAVSNTSDYGSNTMSSENTYNLRIKDRQLGDSLLPREHNSSAPSLTNAHHTVPLQSQSNVIVINSVQNANGGISTDSLGESAKTKPFTTFHGDLV